MISLKKIRINKIILSFFFIQQQWRSRGELGGWQLLLCSVRGIDLKMCIIQTEEEKSFIPQAIAAKRAVKSNFESLEGCTIFMKTLTGKDITNKVFFSANRRRFKI